MLVVVGASLLLFPHRLREIAALVDVPLVYDASHVAGLVAEGRFQAPLAEGADLMTFSTYKSFGGPPGGAIVTSDEALAEKLSTAVYPGSDRELRRRAAAAADRRRAGARALRAAPTPTSASPTPARWPRGLDARGLRGARRGPRVHRVPPRRRRRARRSAAATPRRSRWPAQGILLSEIGVPEDAEGGLRFGTQAITRQGFVEDDMPGDRGRVRGRAAARRGRRRGGDPPPPHGCAGCWSLRSDDRGGAEGPHLSSSADPSASAAAGAGGGARRP